MLAWGARLSSFLRRGGRRSAGSMIGQNSIAHVLQTHQCTQRNNCSISSSVKGWLMIVTNPNRDNEFTKSFEKASCESGSSLLKLEKSNRGIVMLGNSSLV